MPTVLWSAVPSAAVSAAPSDDLSRSAAQLAVLWAVQLATPSAGPWAELLAAPSAGPWAAPLAEPSAAWSGAWLAAWSEVQD